MAFLHLVVLVVLAATLEPAMTNPILPWLNSWDAAVNFQCGTNSVLHYIYSEHHNFFEDRRWKISCKDFGHPLANCYWTEQTKYDQLWTVSCNGQGVITGMKSTHHNLYEDRAFQFKCCEAPLRFGLNLQECTQTPWINDYDRPLSYTVPDDSVITGVKAEHNNHFEDRKFSFHVCKIPHCECGEHH